jgi:MFS family permease
MPRAGAVPSGVPFSTLVALMLAVFTVSIGYGVVLPLLPYLIERLLNPATGSPLVARHTGLLSGTYTLGLFLFAPVWGHLSDRFGRRRILLVGMLGFAASTLAFSFVENLPAIYAERFLSGMFAAAVTPVASAAISDLASSDESRAIRLTMVSVAGITGFLLGPMVGVFIARFVGGLFALKSASGSLAIPLAATALLVD